MGLAAVLLLVVAYFALSSSSVVSALRRFENSRARALLLVGLLLIPYLLAAAPVTGPAEFLSGLLRMAAYLFIPTFALLLRPWNARPLSIYDIAAILALWFPIEFGWLPDLSVQLLPNVSLPVSMLTGICLGFVLFLVIRPVERIGYTYKLGPKDILYAIAGLIAFSVVGLPLGFAMGFIGIGAEAFDAAGWLARFLAIYFLIGIPEEFLFRGLIQNLLEQRLGRRWAALVVAALIFGAAHVDNATAHYGVPNWPYVVMATLAGLAYGWVWRSREKVTASALTHTLVDFTWDVLLKG